MVFLHWFAGAGHGRRGRSPFGTVSDLTVTVRRLRRIGRVQVFAHTLPATAAGKTGHKYRRAAARMKPRGVTRWSAQAIRAESGARTAAAGCAGRGIR